MKYLLTILLLGVITLSSLLSAPRYSENNKNTIGKDYLYEINIPSKTVNGRYIPAKKVQIERVDANFVEKNIIEVKFKQHVQHKNNKFDEPTLQSAFNSLSISSITTPYSNYINDENLLSNNKIGIDRIYQIRYSDNIDPYDACANLMKNSDVEYATPVFKRQTYFTPNDAWYSLQYHLPKISMPEAWDITQGDGSVVIAIVDSGTDIEHEDLKENIWTNPGEIPNNGIDDDKNGKIDDVNGWDLIGSITAQQLASGAYKEDNNPINMIGTHGTHTAGCASASTNNSKGVAAPGFKIKLLPVKCASDAYNSPGISRGYEGILYAARTGAKVINCSWGGPGWSPVEEDIVNQAIAMGSLIVTASGNSAKNIDVDPDYPAAFKGVLSVGSSGNTDRYSNFSSYGNLVRVYAPGEGIWSTLPGNKYEAQSGTSMASPVAAGVAALLMTLHKDWTTEQIIHQLRGTSDNVLVAANPNLRPLYFGRLNAFKALQYNYVQGKTIAGIGLENIEVKGNANALTNYELNDVTISLKNYLARDNSIKVRLIPMDNFIEFDKSIYDVGMMDTFDEKELSVKARLLENNPWYKGTADVLLEITGTDYINYEIAKINVQVPSNNKLTLLTSIPSAYGIQWHSNAFLGNDIAYIVGAGQFVGGVAVKMGKASANVIQINQQPVYCMYAFNESNLIAGDGPTNGMARVHYSNNGGQTWSTKPVNNITGFVNSFNFFNNFEGILLGDPLGTSWGVGKTNDGGNTWTLASGLPAPIGTETGLVGSVTQRGNTVWFGTTAGRIFKTNDKGETWDQVTVASGGVVSSLSFNESLAACLYSPTNTQGANRLLAVSTDGGKTWKTSVYNFTANSQIPLNVYVIEDSKSIVVQLYSGYVIASDNEGVSWYPVLSEKRNYYTFAATNQIGNKVSIYSGGTDMTRLDYTFTPSVIKKAISFVGGSLAIFDSVAVNSTKDMTVEIRNVGNMDVAISNINIIPDEGTDVNEFRVLLPSPTSVIPGQNTNLRLRFTPKSSGLKTARLTITSDAEINQMHLDLIGYGATGTSIDDLNAMDKIILAPNPADKFITVFSDQELNNSVIKIYDILGNEILKLENVGQNSLINLQNFAPGVYNLILNDGKNIYQKQFIINR